MRSTLVVAFCFVALFNVNPAFAQGPVQSAPANKLKSPNCLPPAIKPICDSPNILVCRNKGCGGACGNWHCRIKTKSIR